MRLCVKNPYDNVISSRWMREINEISHLLGLVLVGFRIKLLCDQFNLAKFNPCSLMDLCVICGCRVCVWQRVWSGQVLAWVELKEVPGSWIQTQCFFYYVVHAVAGNLLALVPLSREATISSERMRSSATGGVIFDRCVSRLR